MTDLISREAAIKEAYNVVIDGSVFKVVQVETLYGLPTIDAVPVVRCKDCKHSELWHSDRRRCFLWCETGNSVWDDGYCSYGERREDDTAN